MQFLDGVCGIPNDDTACAERSGVLATAAVPKNETVFAGPREGVSAMTLHAVEGGIRVVLFQL